jgi:GntR family transcriptional repressor for pyruvate dehydrogenase complex
MSKLELNQVRRVRVFEHAVNQIRAVIERGDLEPGDRLPTEQMLSQDLNVSRSSIREALRVLEAEGLIEVRRGSGAFVAPRTSWKSSTRSAIAAWIGQRQEALHQLLEVREYIEGLTARLAATSATDALIDKLRKIVQEQASSCPDEPDVDAIAELDNHFHLQISAASGNDIADEIMNHILPSFNQSNKAVIFAGQRAEDIVQEHRAIVEAIAARDGNAAERAMRAHITQVQRVIRNIQKES